jgi:hypothetical protein
MPSHEIDPGNGEMISLGGKITTEQVVDGALDLVRLWQEPDGLLWAIGSCTYYNMDSIRRQEGDGLPYTFCAARGLSQRCSHTPCMTARVR